MKILGINIGNDSGQPVMTQERAEQLAQNAVKEALASEALKPNSSLDYGVRARMAQAISGGYDMADTMHNVYLDFGYPATLNFTHFWNMYRRFGIAKNVVELIPDTGWMTDPRIIESDSLEKEVDTIDKRLSLWSVLKAVDTRQRVGRYAGIFMRVRDGKTPEHPIEGKLSGEASLAGMMPLYENQLEVLTIQTDAKEDNFGQPTMYQYSAQATGNRNEKITSTFKIHPDRLVMVSEEADKGSIYGVSVLEACYNSLMDLRKIMGAGGEGFYKNAAQEIIFKMLDPSSAAGNEELLEEFNEKFDDFQKNRFRRGMWTPGLEPVRLESHLMSPKEFVASSLSDVAACTKVPATIIVGQQTGRLASNEDSKSFLTIVQARRGGFQTDLVRDTIEWFMQFGIVARSEYDVEWDDLLARSDDEKQENANKMADTNYKQFQSGGSIPFTGEEVREAAGYEPVKLEEPEETGDEVVDIDDEE